MRLSKTLHVLVSRVRVCGRHRVDVLHALPKRHKHTNTLEICMQAAARTNAAAATHQKRTHCTIQLQSFNTHNRSLDLARVKVTHTHTMG